jgi:hypothetical protein
VPERTRRQSPEIFLTSRRIGTALAVASSLWLGACAASTRVSASVAGDATSETDASRGATSEAKPSASAPGSPEARGKTAEKGADKAGGAEIEAAPHYDPKLVRDALDRTASPPDERARLGARLALVDQGPDAPWLIAIVNRGTEPLRVTPDLRTLSLTITPPTPEPDPSKKAKPVRAPKPVTCVLPRDLSPSEEEPAVETLLEPGEGLVDSFDPRLYCLGVAKSPLVPGAQVVGRLGWAEKTKSVWKKGKREQVVLEQTAPFVVRRLAPEGSLPDAAPAPAPAALHASEEPGVAPRSDADGIKQLVTASITLGSEYAPRAPAPDPEPLGLLLTRGSDARTERDATISVSLVNRSKKPQRVFFRRELVSFEISGPSGIVTCEPGPDNRAPDRSSVKMLRPGGRISAISRLIELCPAGALRRPGLYLVHGRFQGIGGAADPQAPPAFEGRLVSHDPVQIRVRRGWGPLPPQRAPERVRVGMP